MTTSTEMMAATPELAAVADALEATVRSHTDLAGAIAKACQATSVRTVARLLNVPPNTVQRWRTDLPGTPALLRAYYETQG